MTSFFTETRLSAAQQPPNNTAPRINIHPSSAHVTTRTHDNYQSGRSYEHNDGGAQHSVSHIAAANNRPFFSERELRTTIIRVTLHTPHNIHHTKQAHMNVRY